MGINYFLCPRSGEFDLCLAGVGKIEPLVLDFKHFFIIIIIFYFFIFLLIYFYLLFFFFFAVAEVVNDGGLQGTSHFVLGFLFQIYEKNLRFETQNNEFANSQNFTFRA